jgi:hypothetical protein
VLIEPRSDDLVRGRAAVAARLAHLFQAGYQLVPASAHVAGAARYLDLYLERDHGDARVPFGEALLTAERDDDVWHVVTETLRVPGPEVLVPFDAYALDELRRCAAALHAAGLKLHFANSGVVLTNPEHVEVVQAVFAEANRLHLPIVVQVQNEAGYGTRDAQIFLTEVPPRAPDVVVQLAHMAGSGADAIARRDPRTARLYFDVATNAEGQSYARLALLAKRIREIGTDHILHGSDASFGKHLTPRQEWATFQGYVPLAPVEIAAIANNIAPYLR